MSQRAPRVVALVPAWNAAVFVQDTLEALRTQSYENLRVLVSVDLSSDATADICTAFCAADPRFHVIRQARRLGFVGNTRALLNAAEGDYCFWAWHDDIVLPDYVSRLVAALEDAPHAVCAYTDVEFHQIDGSVEIATYTRLDGVADPVERARRVIRRPTYWWLPHRGLFRSHAGARIGGFRRHWAGDYCADWPWAVHMAILGAHVRVPAVLCRKFLKPGSLSKQSRSTPWNDVAAALSCAAEVRRTDLSVRQKARLHASVAGYIKRTVVDAGIRRNPLRRLGMQPR